MAVESAVLPATSAEREASLLASVPTGLLVVQWLDASDGGTFDVRDPAKGEVLATLASATSEDAVAALDAACEVQASGVISNAAAPFGRVKQSGLGRESGKEGIAEYTTTQYIGIADPYES
jgi:acyl-CoA reductase-like NAD-dependent aldehyde dehydrogenase